MSSNTAPTGTYGKRRLASDSEKRSAGGDHAASGSGSGGITDFNDTHEPFFTINAHQNNNNNNNQHHNNNNHLHLDHHHHQNDDDVAPIPFFGINTAQSQDDDTISQITTSVASQSYGDSRGSGNYPWLRQNSAINPRHHQNNNNNYNHNHNQRPSSHTLNNHNHNHNNHISTPQHHQLGATGAAASASASGTGDNHSYADTLDEIADMLHPTQPVRRAASSSDYFRSKSPGDDLFRTPASSSNYHHLNKYNTNSNSNNIHNDDFIFGGGVAGGDISINNSNNNHQRHHPHPSHNPNDRAAPGVLFSSSKRPQNITKPVLALTPTEIYRKSKATATPSLSSSVSSKKVNPRRQPPYEPFLSQIRFQFRYLSSLILPRKWREARKKQKHRQGDDDDIDDVEEGGAEQDYFGKLVRNNVTGSTSTPNKNGTSTTSSKKKHAVKKGGKPGAAGRKQQQLRRRRLIASISNIFFKFCVFSAALLVLRFALGGFSNYHYSPHYYYGGGGAGGGTMWMPAIFTNSNSHKNSRKNKDKYYNAGVSSGTTSGIKNSNKQQYHNKHHSGTDSASSPASSSSSLGKNLGIQDGRNVRGGMATRDINPNVRGGMARHSSDFVDPSVSQENQQQQQDEDEQDEPGFQHHHHLGMEIPKVFDDAFANVIDLPTRSDGAAAAAADGRHHQQQHGTKTDIPFFWHIPRTGGGTINDIFGGCLALTLASDAGGAGPAGQEHKLEVVKFSKRYHYVNVDTSTPEGIVRAKRLRLVESDMADIIVSTLLHQAATLFSRKQQGRMFTVFRHPVERAASLFHYIQDTQWRRQQTYKKELSDLTIDDFFKSGLAENNWMTRFLTNELTKGELTKEDLHLAKEILRRKCLIGLLSEKGETFARFEKYFGFPVKDDSQKDCHERKLQWAWPLKHRHPDVEEGSPLWDLIMSQNMLDMELYDYAQILFREQSKLFQ